MNRIKTINGIDMIQCGDFNWEILKEIDGSEVYKLVITKDDLSKDHIILIYGRGVFSVRNFNAFQNGGDYFCFKMNFEETPDMVQRLIDGEGGILRPIYHKNTVRTS